jgi:hypothetical protein
VCVNVDCRVTSAPARPVGELELFSLDLEAHG